MIDKVTVTDPGYNWDWWGYSAMVIGAVLLGALVFWLLSFAMSTRKSTVDTRNIAWILLVIAAIAIPVGAGINATYSGVSRNVQIDEAKDRQIAELGYLNLDKESEYYQYTAVKDNQYVRLVIIEYPTLTWQIMLLDMNVEKE
ncbi:membrane protein [Microbacterium phage Zooman]|nr:membrane protein [Microbacterium phage Zooman]